MRNKVIDPLANFAFNGKIELLRILEILKEKQNDATDNGKYSSVSLEIMTNNNTAKPYIQLWGVREENDWEYETRIKYEKIMAKE